ncbi:DUF4266 domain-containing protein [Hymenobacter aquaticus]|uniref:DUF4266 domain-containing protein n=1 Tax=Hymenobacter aquaticus TaxID=1867101 RepID=A0A4Z0Q3E5_9BACT|nr:DUF4266 domain-containing protein [Hymenobacter aquaticus]TGE24540.1 DUF4266 domain-containing protein [Hymenobacter aquaticus]
MTRVFPFSTFSRLLRGLVLVVAAAALPGCVSVAAYQKVYLNDEDMKLANKRVEVYETNFESYREGAGGANGGKVGGGCGCN